MPRLPNRQRNYSQPEHKQDKGRAIHCAPLAFAARPDARVTVPATPPVTANWRPASQTDDERAGIETLVAVA